MSSNSNQSRNHFFEWALVIGRAACLLFFTIIGSILVGGFVWDWLSDKTEIKFFVYIGCAVSVIVSYIAIDWILEKLLDLISNDVVTPEWKTYSPEKKKLLRIVTGLAVLLLFVRGTMSFWTNAEIANSVVERPKTEGLTELAINQTESFDKNMNGIDSELTLARKTETKRVSAAKSQGGKSVQSVINIGTTDQRKMWNKSRSYLNSLKGKRFASSIKYREGIYKAKSDSAAMVNVELSKVKILEDAKLGLLTGGSLRKDTTLSQITGVITGENNQYQNRFGDVRKILIGLEFLNMILIPFFTYILGLWYFVYGKSIESSHKGLVSLLISFSVMITSVIVTFGEWVIKTVSVKLNIDVVTSHGVHRATKRQSDKRSQLATTSAAVANSPALEPMSDKEPQEIVRYVDLKNEIDKKKKRWVRAMKSGDKGKATEIENKDFAALEQKGFVANFDRVNLKVSITKK